MEEDITWTGEEIGNEPHDNYPMNEEETPCPIIVQVVTAETQTKD